MIREALCEAFCTDLLVTPVPIGFAVRTPHIKADGDYSAFYRHGAVRFIAGRGLPGVPRHRATASFDYRKSGWTLQADLQAVLGQILFGDEANRVAPKRPYLVAGVTGSVMLGKVSLFGAAANLLGARFATFGTFFSPTDQIALRKAPGANNPRSLGPATPKRVTIGLSARF